MADKVEVKWIENAWNAFMPNGTVLKSAGVGDIVDQVEEAWPTEKGYSFKWEARDGKFVVRHVESVASKLSKSDE